MSKYKTALDKMGAPFPPSVDARAKPAKRWAVHFEHLLALAQRKGEVTELERQLCRRGASLMLLQERNEAALLEGKDINQLAYVRVCGAIARTLRYLSIGIDEAYNEEDQPGPSIHELLGRAS